jgi:hypothetical protein
LLEGITPTKFGRYHVAEPFRPDRMHFHLGGDLKEVDHEPLVPVLDQEDLISQGIDTATLIPGAQQVNALGSCTCNAGTVSLAERLASAHGGPGSLAHYGLSTTDAVRDEEFAIVEYHNVTRQTGEPSTEWPPTDCGSSGYYVCTEFERQGFISSFKSANGMTNLVSLLQAGTVIQGTPWFNAWMEPDNGGFIDGDGSADTLIRAIQSGVAGGHETCITAVEKLSVDLLGRVDADQTVVRVRNSWSSSWGDSGSFRLHLSTLEYLTGHVDFKQFVI